ncbi:hypothetical protein Q3G72_011332 [Acer saccharum]|nr:hypothetical protein Q3G72_011332 [Acer saccharum]
MPDFLFLPVPVRVLSDSRQHGTGSPLPIAFSSWYSFFQPDPVVRGKLSLAGDVREPVCSFSFVLVPDPDMGEEGDKIIRAWRAYHEKTLYEVRIETTISSLSKRNKRNTQFANQDLDHYEQCLYLPPSYPLMVECGCELVGFVEL